MRPLVVFLVCASCALSGPSAAARSKQGNDLARAKRLFNRAEGHFHKGKIREALQAYQKAYKAKPLPGFHFNIGQCYRSLGDHEKAIHHFERYIMRSTNPRNREDARRLLELSQKELAEQQRVVKQDAEEKPPDLAPESQPVVTPLPPPRKDRPRRLPAAYFWSGVGITAALLAATTVTGALALSHSSKFKDLSTPQDDLQGLKDQGQALSTTASVTFGLGLAMATATTVLYFWTDLASKETAVTAAPLRRGALVTMGGRF